MKRWTAIAVMGLFLLVALVAFQMGRRTAQTGGAEEEHRHVEEHGEHKDVTVHEEGLSLVGIKTALVEWGEVSTVLEATGEVVANTNKLVKVGSFVAGRISKLRVNVGDTVRAGDVLAIVDSTEVAQAQAAFEQAKAKVEAARRNLENVRRLARAGAFTQPSLYQAQRDYAQAQKEVASAEAAVSRAQAAMDLAKAELGRQQELAKTGRFSYPPLQEAEQEHAAAFKEVALAQAELAKANKMLELAKKERDRKLALFSAGAYQFPELKAARDEEATAQRAVIAAEKELAFAKIQEERAERLYKIGTYSKRQLEEAQTARQVTEAVLTEAKKRLETAERRLEQEERIFKENLRGKGEVATAETEVDKAQADVDEKVTALEQAQRRLALAEKRLKQEREIAEQNIYAQSAVQQAQTASTAAQKELMQRQAELEQAKKQLEIAERTLEREQKVAQRNLLANRELVAAQASYDQARVELLAAQNALRLFHIASPSLLHHSPNGRGDGGEGAVGIPILAPISGRVLERPVTLGETVQANATLFTLLDLSSVWVDANVYEKDIGKVRVGQTVEVRATAYPNETFYGKVHFISDVLDEKTRTIKVRCEIANLQRKLKPEMFVRARIATGTRRALVIPRAAAQNEGGKSFVFVEESKGKFERREVKTGSVSGGLIEIISGLKSGERIVTEGAFLLKSEEKKGEFGEEH